MALQRPAASGAAVGCAKMGRLAGLGRPGCGGLRSLSLALLGLLVLLPGRVSGLFRANGRDCRGGCVRESRFAALKGLWARLTQVLLVCGEEGKGWPVSRPPFPSRWLWVG